MYRSYGERCKRKEKSWVSAKEGSGQTRAESGYVVQKEQVRKILIHVWLWALSIGS